MSEQLDKICKFIRQIDPEGDTIILSRNVRHIMMLLRENVQNFAMLREAFVFFNNVALQDSQVAINFAVFSSMKTVDSLEIHGSKIRDEMLYVLEKNFEDMAKHQQHDLPRFYNSLTLLGEYYNRVRLANGQPIKILGQSLLAALISELESRLKKHENCMKTEIKEDFAKLILSQISLNGLLAKSDHKQELTTLLFLIRKCLIKMDDLEPITKAFLIMTLDLYYSNFTSIGVQLEEFYSIYLINNVKPIENDTGRSNIVSKEKAATVKLNGTTTKVLNDCEPQIDNNTEKQNNKESSHKLSQINNHNQHCHSNGIPISDHSDQETSTTNTAAEIRSDLSEEDPITVNETILPSLVETLRSNTQNNNSDDHACNTEQRSLNNQNRDENTTEVPSTPELNGESAHNKSGTETKAAKAPKSRSTSDSQDKAYFRKENSENITWEPYTADDEDVTPRTNPYSQSFLNFLGNP